jgi:RNA polymerase sigma-70 factor, ECF subfamily
MSALPSTPIPEPAAPSLEADLGALYTAYSSRIFGYCLRRLPNREEAEDAVQHTFMNAFRGLRQGVVPRSEAAWLFKIAENVCRERLRSAWRRNRVETVQDPEGIATLAVAPQRTHDELAGLADALAELPPNQQRAILLREWQGLSYREIAAQLELTEGAVETLLFRARRSLARKLDRSRGRAWALDLGSLAAWGKSLFAGAAAKVAATAVIVAGVTVATPALRHELARALPSGRAHQAQPRPAAPGASAATTRAGRSAGATSPAAPTRASKLARPRTAAKSHPPGEGAGTGPETATGQGPTAVAPVTAPQAPEIPHTPKAPDSPQLPQAPQIPPTSPLPQAPSLPVPPPPPLPVQVPPPPAAPTVTTPNLPAVQTPSLP